MSYTFIQEKIDKGKIILLDGGIGAELEKKGAKMDKNLWCGKCSVDSPEFLKKVHENYIDAGADVITTNTYAATPISLRKHGYEESIELFNKQAVQIAKNAIENTNKQIALAGSVSSFGSFYNLGVKAMIPGFREQMKILYNEGVDLIILEGMTSQAEILETMIECSLEINLPIWLSISCVINIETNEINLGYNDGVDKYAEIYERLDESLDRFSKLHKGPILIAHSDFEATTKAIDIAVRNFNGIVGVYPNKGYYEKPNWKFVDDMLPNEYLEQARMWIDKGVKIVGGCCGIGVDEIKAISILK